MVSSYSCRPALNSGRSSCQFLPKIACAYSSCSKASVSFRIPSPASQKRPSTSFRHWFGSIPSAAKAPIFRWLSSAPALMVSRFRAARIASVSVSISPDVFRIRWSCSGVMSHWSAVVFSSSAQAPAPSVFCTRAVPISQAFLMTLPMLVLILLSPSVTFCQLTPFPICCSWEFIPLTPFWAVSPATPMFSRSVCIPSSSPCAFSTSCCIFWNAVLAGLIPCWDMARSAFSACSTTFFWFSIWDFSSSAFCCI